MIFEPKIIKQFEQCGIAFLDAPSEVFKAALFYLGLNPNTKNPRDYQGEAYQLLKDIRPYIRYFHSSQYINDLANGEICLVFGWSGDILQSGDRAEEAGNGINIGYEIPKEGAQMWVDMMAIPNDAPNAKKLSSIIKDRSKGSQFIMVSLKDSVVEKARLIYGVFPKGGVSNVVKYKDKKMLNLEEESTITS